EGRARHMRSGERAEKVACDRHRHGLALWRPCLALALLVGALAAGAKAQSKEAFAHFIEAIWPEAQALGVSRATFERAVRGVEVDPTLPDLVLPGQDTKGQAEFTKTPSKYLNAGYLARLAEQGRALKTAHAAALAKIERELAVPGPVVLAIWGRETQFGGHR